MEHHLEKSLSALKLWAIMVGMVISGQYFGWNYGLAAGGVLGFSIAVLLVVVFYSSFIFTCAELSTLFPKAGGPSVFVTKAFGPFAGFVTALACLMEFLFAVPAIAVAIGDYMHFLWPFMTVTAGTLISLVIVFYINLMRVGNIAKVELIATSLALLGLFICYAVGAFSAVHWHLHLQTLPITGKSWHVCAAIPFAIWLFLAIEGGALSAEEVKRPQKNIPRGFIAALLTVIGCTLLTVSVTLLLGGMSIAHAGAPLPLALSTLNTAFTQSAAKVVDMLGIFGLFASLNGITLGYSRQVYAMGEAGFLPRVFKRLSANESPYVALLVPGIIILLFAVSAHASKALVVIAVLGAICMYLLVLAAFFKIRLTHKDARACFSVPFFMPLLAFILGSLFLYSICVYSVLPAHLSFMGMHLPALVFVITLAVIACVIYGILHFSRHVLKTHI